MLILSQYSQFTLIIIVFFAVPSQFLATRTLGCTMDIHFLKKTKSLTIPIPNFHFQTIRSGTHKLKENLKQFKHWQPCWFNTLSLDLRLWSSSLKTYLFKMAFNKK